jgi:hypothetical protein
LEVNDFITKDASSPEIRIIATPDVPGPVDRAKIVIKSPKFQILNTIIVFNLWLILIFFN